MSNNKKILVTGTAGFIGFHLAERLASDGHTVVGLDNINDYYDPKLKLARLKELGIEATSNKRSATNDEEQHRTSNFEQRSEANSSTSQGEPKGVKPEPTSNFQPPASSFQQFPWHQMITSTKYPNLSFIRLDLADHDRVVALMQEEQFDYVVNLAAQAGVRHSIKEPREYTRSNIEGFLSILEGCRHTDVQHLVYASTSSVFGKNSTMPLSEDQATEHPISLYSATKKANEMMAHSYSHLYHLPSTGLRFFTVYGPWGRPDMALFLFADAIRQGKPIKVFNHGHMIRDFTYVDDIVESMARLLPKPPQPNPDWTGDQPHTPTSDVPYQVFNIGNGQPVPLMDYIKALENAMGREAKKEFLPMQPGDVPATHADTERLADYTGFRPQTGIQEGLSSFVEWYKMVIETKVEF